MRDSRNRSIAAVAIAMASVTGSASAGTVLFTYSDGFGLIANGTLTVTAPVAGVYTATSGVLNITAAPLLPSAVGSYPLLAAYNAPSYSVSPGNAFWYNNLLYIPPVGGPGGYLDQYGLLFIDNGGQQFNIWGQNSPNAGTYTGMRGTAQGAYNYNPNQLQNGNFVVTLVPLPTGAAIGFAGLGMVGVICRRRAIG